MEDIVKCPLCRNFFEKPVLLPCHHALCLTCALDTQVQIVNNHNSSNSVNTLVTAQIHQPPSNNQIQTLPRNNSTSGHCSGNSSTTESVSSEQDIDKVSILSDSADSGVICTSRPNSYAGTLNLQALLFPPSGGAVYSLTCPVCGKIVFFDDAGARNLSTYRIMETIVDRFCEREALRCQMCENEPKIASIICEQCDIRYCEECLYNCHPLRGPLAKHNLVAPKNGVSSIREAICLDHTSEVLTIFCLTCKLALCQQCLDDNRHQSHEIQSIAAICKSQKVINCYLIFVY